MSVKKRNYFSSSQNEYTVCYKNMRGVDFTSESNSPLSNRFSYAENMYRDYEGDGGEILESVPGFRIVATTNNKAKVNSIFSYKDNLGEEYIVIHAGKSLFRLPISNTDNPNTILSPIGTLKGTKSRAFNFENSIYILDGETITVIDGEGKVSTLEDLSEEIYVPTTYVNGEEHEQRNLLSNYFYENYSVGNSDSIATASENIEYQIISEVAKTCAVKGGNFTENTSLHIPAYIKIGQENYKITEIADGAFSGNSYVRNLTIAKGLEKIGKNAFNGCINLGSAILPEGINFIGDYAFAACTSLFSINIGKSVKYIGKDIFINCTNLPDIEYAGTEEEFAQIDSHTDFSRFVINCETENNSITIRVPVFSPAKQIIWVKIDGQSRSFSTVMNGGLVSEITLYSENKNLLNGKEITIYGIMDDSKFTQSKYSKSYMSEHSVAGSEAIKKCTVCESFDGRIFLSGNPALPNTVFYSQRERSGRNNPLYFGVLNYFNDGLGTHPVSSLLAIGDSIAVFKEGDDTGGSIFYHTSQSTGIDCMPKIYPVSYIHNGISSIGETISFFDSPIFISQMGVSAIKESDYSQGKSIEVRSHNINPKLLGENLSEIRLAKWRGYLVLAVGGRIYLGDSRQIFKHKSGSYEYEWYFLNGIGTYTNDIPVYRYASSASDEYLKNPREDEIVYNTIYSITFSGHSIYFTNEFGKKYAVYKTEERMGGIFNEETAIYSHKDELLFFGTSGGQICLFNSDKRGVPPKRISENKDFDPEEYKKSFAMKIHSDFYDFALHAPTYVARTVMDDCQIPHLTKSTVKNSLNAKVRIYSRGDISFDVKTDKSDYSEKAKIPDTVPDFEDMDFTSFSFINSDYSTIAIKEKEKNWIEKQLQVSSQRFRSPFGICTQSYRFTVKGRIKNT